MIRPLSPFLAFFAVLSAATAAAPAPAPAQTPPGTVLWQFSANDYVYGAPAVDAAGNVYFGSMDGNLYSLDSTGNLRWTYAAGAPLGGTPTADGTGHVYFGDERAWIHKVRVADGSRVWRTQLPGALTADPKPAISLDGSLVFVGSVDTAQEGTLWALDTANGGIQWAERILQYAGLYDRFERNDIHVAPNGNVVAIGWDRGSLGTFKPDGTMVWSWPSALTNTPSNVVVDGQNRVFGYSYWGFYAFDPGGGLLWDKWYHLYAGLDPLAVGPDDWIFAAYGGRIRGHDRDDGNIRWTTAFSYSAIQLVYEPTRDLVYAVGTDYQNRAILALNRFGAVQWQAPWPGFAYRAPVVSADGSVLYLTDQDGALYAISTGDAPPALHLTVGVLIRGLPSTLTTQSAAAGETVHFLYSSAGTGAGPCPGQLGGLCLDLLDPVKIAGSAVADASGKAVLGVSVPASAPLVDIHFQAVARRGVGGVDSVKSNAVTSTIF